MLGFCLDKKTYCYWVNSYEINKDILPDVFDSYWVWTEYNASTKWVGLLTLSTHPREGYSSCPVCLSVTL